MKYALSVHIAACYVCVKYALSAHITACYVGDALSVYIAICVVDHTEVWSDGCLQTVLSYLLEHWNSVADSKHDNSMDLHGVPCYEM